MLSKLVQWMRRSSQVVFNGCWRTKRYITENPETLYDDIRFTHNANTALTITIQVILTSLTPLGSLKDTVQQVLNSQLNALLGLPDDNTVVPWMSFVLTPMVMSTVVSSVLSPITKKITGILNAHSLTRYRELLNCIKHNDYPGFVQALRTTSDFATWLYQYDKYQPKHKIVFSSLLFMALFVADPRFFYTLLSQGTPYVPKLSRTDLKPIHELMTKVSDVKTNAELEAADAFLSQYINRLGHLRALCQQTHPEVVNEISDWQQPALASHQKVQLSMKALQSSSASKPLKT